jgi:t-SNARE complex subunit (syntaxin)
MVRISMPKKLMSDINRGYRNLDSNKVEDILNKQGVVVSQPDAAEAQVQDMANAEQPTA